MSFQPEERYWTDYLRIALPVIGLLILIGLLWYWASALIGSPGDNEPTPVPTLAEIVPTEPPPATPEPTPTPTAPAIVATEGPPPTATPEPAINPTVPPQTEDDTEAQPEGTNTLPECQNRDTYESGTTVVTSADVNFRTEANTESQSLGILPPGTQLQVTGPFVDLPDCDWWPVTNPATGDSGFIREDFLERAGE